MKQTTNVYQSLSVLVQYVILCLKTVLILKNHQNQIIAPVQSAEVRRNENQIDNCIIIISIITVCTNRLPC